VQPTSFFEVSVSPSFGKLEMPTRTSPAGCVSSLWTAIALPDVFMAVGTRSPRAVLCRSFSVRDGVLLTIAQFAARCHSAAEPCVFSPSEFNPHGKLLSCLLNSTSSVKLWPLPVLAKMWNRVAFKAEETTQTIADAEIYSSDAPVTIFPQEVSLACSI
jgi:hypothetical protein